MVRTVVTETAVIFYTQSQIAGSLLCVQIQHFKIMRMLEMVYTKSHSIYGVECMRNLQSPSELRKSLQLVEIVSG